MFLSVLAVALLLTTKAFANPACAVCTVAEIVSSSEGTQRRTRAFSV